MRGVTDEFIPKLLGVAGKGQPWAELWLGTHPNGPTVLDDGTPLEALSGRLSYLLKVLSAAEPLSLQVHPTTEQAEAGYAAGVFGDPHAKPELLVALTEFEALCGVRPTGATLDLLGRLGATELERSVAEHGPGAAIRGLYRGDIDPASAVAACADADGPEAAWASRLARRYPGDPSVAVTLLLNHVVLQPGEALHLTAGNLHGYLHGSGIELMLASDNVVRGGLTEKPVDVDLLLDTLDPTPLADPVMAVDDGRYPLPEAGVVLVRSNRATATLRSATSSPSRWTAPRSTSRPGTPIYADSRTYVVTPLPSPPA